ncbi:hypothetical protein [Bradyrhizobium commune]|uniref:Uncharacterized protein n=1 Tax=Bradyrhizobium commune TaxID=83627 RepID=A0A7S9D198_9BRAD|nr:hypothetical protein [Bradyrhizobium commune]QPF88609.1 hypothetical protein IC761_18895 [Bradyrhizobium commune]
MLNLLRVERDFSLIKMAPAGLECFTSDVLDGNSRCLELAMKGLREKLQVPIASRARDKMGYLQDADLGVVNVTAFAAGDGPKVMIVEHFSHSKHLR